MSLGASMAPGAALVSPRGKVMERGMPRFFGRLAEGVFDGDEVRRRSLDLADFIGDACRAYDLTAPVALGFSNGANVAAAIMLLRPGVLAGAILLRPMQVLEAPPPAGRSAASVLILSGASDPIVPGDSVRALAAQLEAAGATVDHRILRAGHQLIQEDVSLAQAWLESTFPTDPQG